MEQLKGGSVDHLVYGVHDLLGGSTALQQKLGVLAERGGRHEGWGTHNALLSLGERCYLEVIARDPQQSPPPSGWLFDLQGLPRLITWCAAVPDLEARVRRARQRGYDAGEVVSMSRTRPDGSQLHWQLTLPRLANQREHGGVVPFLIDWGSAPHPAGQAPSGCLLRRLEGVHPQPEVPGAILEALELDLPLRRGEQASLVATVQTTAQTSVQIAAQADGERQIELR